ncbi:TetR/AcrR family transcriptional regulator [Rummeliibacillus sp. JY-2-4R]
MEKRDIIIKKSIEILSKRTIASTSIQDITNACGISKGAFYLSFKSKEELLIAIFEYIINDSTHEYQEILNLQAEPREKLIQFFVLSFELLEKYSPFITSHIRELFTIFDQDALEKIHKNFQASDQMTLLLLREVYSTQITESQYDLLICIKGMIKGYGEFIVIQKQTIDYYELSKLLVNRIDVLVHAKLKTLITKEMFENVHHNISHIDKDDIIAGIKKCKEEYSDNPFLLDTFELLMEELKKDHPRIALLQGMTSNLSKNKDLRWLYVLLKQYCDEL